MCVLVSQNWLGTLSLPANNFKRKVIFGKIQNYFVYTSIAEFVLKGKFMVPTIARIKKIKLMNNNNKLKRCLNK